MITKDQIVNLTNEALADSDRFLVDVKVKPGNVIEVYVDADTAVTIDHCVEISRFIEGKLDRDAEDFELSVMSYGLTGILKMDRQLNKYVGKDVEVKTKESGKINGTLVGFDEETVEIKPSLVKSSKKKNAEPLANLVLPRQTTEVKPVIIF